MFLLCSTASDTDPSANKSFTRPFIETLFGYGAGPLISLLLYAVLPPSALRSCVYRPITECDVQVRSSLQASCRAEVDSRRIFLCLVFSAFYHSDPSFGILRAMSQQTAFYTNRRHSCVFLTYGRQATNWTQDICSKSQSSASDILLYSMSLLSQSHRNLRFSYTSWKKHGL